MTYRAQRHRSPANLDSSGTECRSSPGDPPLRRGDPDCSHLGNSVHFRANVSLARDFRSQDPRIQRALKLFQNRYNLPVRAVAASVNLSGSHFRHLFKKELGVPPSRYLKSVRLARAKLLIESSFLRVKEVVALVGMNDVSHFVRSYKRVYNRTPSETRAQLGRVQR